MLSRPSPIPAVMRYIKTRHFIKSFIYLLVISMLFLSCKYQLAEKVKRWNPYKAGDILVFESNDNQSDSFTITGIKQHFTGRNEILEVQCSFIRRDKIFPIKIDTINSWLMALTAWEDGRSVLSININTETARFAAFNAKAITWLDSLPQTTFDLNANHYKDVVTIEPDTNSLHSPLNLNDRLFVKKVLWSKSLGLIKYELRNNKTSWILKNKYSL